MCTRAPCGYSSVPTTRAAARFLPNSPEVWSNLEIAIDSLLEQNGDDMDAAILTQLRKEREECGMKAGEAGHNEL